jgi:glycine cleavage system H protein
MSGTYPDELKYSEDHCWVLLEDHGYALVGLTEYFQNKLGEIFNLSLPEAGDNVSTHDTIGELEAARSVIEIVAPISGNITEINGDLVDAPGLICSDAYGDGWLYRIKLKDLGEYQDLLSAQEYQELLEEEEEQDEDFYE